MRVKNLYISLSIGLILSGIWLAPIAHILLESAPLSALGISMVILGAISYILGRTRPNISPEVSSLLLETGLENISVMVEELGLSSKAVYLPSSMTSGRPRALIPLNGNSSSNSIDRALPHRMIVKYGPNTEDMGLLIATPGSATTKMQETPPASTPAEMETALSSIITGMLDMADSIRVGINEEKAIIEVYNPRTEYEKLQIYECLGSPLASIAASLVAENLEKPVTIEQETNNKNKSVIELRISK